MPRIASLRQRLDRPKLEKLVQSGVPTVRIAERFGSHPANVNKLMDEYGLARRTRSAAKP